TLKRLGRLPCAKLLKVMNNAAIRERMYLVINFFYTICLQKYEEYLKQKNKYKKKAPISVKIHR
ncbi:MAG: hypothetical protein ACOCO6_05970, partial [Segatella copri]